MHNALISYSEFLSRILFYPASKNIAMLLLGVALLFIRNMDPLLQPAMYTEDGTWLGTAFRNGWLYTLLNAKDGYFVWGNLLFLWLSSLSSSLFCGDQLACIPQSIAIWSYIYFSATATFAFAVTKYILPISARWLLFFLIIAMPLGNSANEIIGRLSNIGFLTVFWSVLLVYHKNNFKHAIYKEIFLDFGLILTAATNPLCFVLIPILAVFSIYTNKVQRIKNIARELFSKYKYVFIGLLLLFIFQVSYFSARTGSSIRGHLNPSNLIEVAIARSLLYPIIFPLYSQLNDATTLVYFVLLITFLMILAWKVRNDIRIIQLVGMASIGLFLFLIATIYMRQSLTQQLGGYATTFPDRYFMGLNVLVIFIAVTLAASDTSNGWKNIPLGRCFLVIIGLLYFFSINWLFETNKPKMKIVVDLNFQESLCLKFFKVNQASNTAILPIYFSGWSMTIPYNVLNRTLTKLDCNNANNLFYLTDANWVHGISRGGAGFFVPNNDQSLNQYKPGRFVKVNNSEIRKIISATPAGKYLNMNVDGAVLNPEKVGLPSTFTIIDNSQNRK